MLVSRRWFLIGSSASIAASKLSLTSNALAKPTEVTGAVIPASSWLLQDIFFGARAKQSFPVRLDMDLSCQGFSDPQFNFGVKRHGWHGALGTNRGRRNQSPAGANATGKSRTRSGLGCGPIPNLQ